MICLASNNNLFSILGKLGCYLGFHDFDVISVTFGFGENDNVEKVQCRRCGFVTTRRLED